MTSFLDVVQEVTQSALGADPIAQLRRYRPGLKALRQAYGRSEPPDFSEGHVRGAYVFAYHPHHCVMTVEALSAVGMDLLGFRGRKAITVVVLGAGPAPELVGLTWFLRNAGIAIDAHLIDRESGWERSRKTTIDSTVGRWFNDALSVTHHLADLSTAEGLASVAPLLREADLVIAQAVITELPNPLSEGDFIDYLLDTFGSTTRLLVIDFDRVSGYRGVHDRVDSARNAVVVTTARRVLPAASPPPIVSEHLYDTTDGLRPKRRLHCAVRLLRRPGTIVESVVDPASLTTSQRNALDAFRVFLQGTDRVFVLRGAAGTGKTTMFPALIDCVAQLGLPSVILAPTGQAARRLSAHTGRSGTTLHSYLYRFAEQEEAEGDGEQIVTRFVPRAAPSEPAVYIVDEASLIGDLEQPDEDADFQEVVFGDGRLLSDTLVACLHAEGSRIVFVGDPNQLPPVGENTSPALDPEYLSEVTSGGVAVAELAEVLRQAEGSGVLRLAHTVLRIGAAPTSGQHDPGAGVVVVDGARIDGWLEHDIAGGAAVVVAARNADVRIWNEKIRASIGRTGSTPVAGERLLVLRTDPVTGLVNGDEVMLEAVGVNVTIVRVRDEVVRLRSAVIRIETAAGPVDFSASIVEDLLFGGASVDQQRVSRVLWIDFVKRTGLRPGSTGFMDVYMQDDRVHALRVSYGFARTCHRAQGGEWDNVIVDFAGSRSFGHHVGRWAYTALTRARRSVHLVHVGEQAFDAIDLVSGATRVLSSVGIEVVDHRQIQNGVKLIAANPSGDRVAVDLHLKNGAPSKAVPRSADRNGMHRRVIDVLNTWAAEQRSLRLPPLPPKVHDLIGRLTRDVAPEGFDLVADHRAEYQLALTLRSAGGSATIVYNFNSSGDVSSERSVESDGDQAVVERLRAIVKEARG